MSGEQPRCVWLSDDLCGDAYTALAQAYHNDLSKADEFHARWKAAPADATEAVRAAFQYMYPEMPMESEVRAVLRALGCPS